MLRFVKNTKKKREFREIGDLTVHEIEHAEKTLIKIVQAKFFPTEDSFPNMNVSTDEEGIKRVKTRITVSGQIIQNLFTLLFYQASVLLHNGSLSTITDKILMLEHKFFSEY
ncbi:integrase_H2C2 domain-containing protein [Trichonephila inaurata madagascariensis]|uniref:Integrase_H2C2 domain-containing protein n=1 Tax=Trichonephila inaurata madagascariensis TaxID=2747483 RepID=A0A8X7C6C4_9ARAC|nr:integrase_H2C2 domain-containing protein [Trichonephila inaurata madagascariensis]